MPVNRPFENGIHGIIKISWKLHLDTPLAIRNGFSFKWKSTEGEKARNDLVEFQWNESKQGDYHDLMDLNFVIELRGQELVPLYQVPASSLRGALRLWTIRHLVDRSVWPALAGKKEIPFEEIKQWCLNLKNGFALLTGLFGIALEGVFNKENPEEAEGYAHAGRLRVNTAPFAIPGAAAEPATDHFQIKKGHQCGPNNVNRQVNLRGPVDRITHSAKEGGLHTFLEFSSGQNFDAGLVILNPVPEDLGLVALWEREMEYGFLRLGAVSSVGRGRIHVDGSKSDYEIYSLPGEDLSEFFESSAPDAEPYTDKLADLWEKRTIPWNDTARNFYLKKLKTQFS